MNKKYYFSVGLLFFSPFSIAESVIYYDSAPSLEEVQRQLLGTASLEIESPKKKRTRSFHIDGEKPLTSADAEGESTSVQTTKIVIGGNKTNEVLPTDDTGKNASKNEMPAEFSAKKVLAFPINFDVGSARLKPESGRFLEVIAELVNKRKISLMIEGHTDISGNPKTNFELSRDRAYSVVNQLVDTYGVDPARLSAMGMGSKQPMNGEPANSSKNRRVQVRVRGI